jgi:cytochrome c peroxidase
MDGPAVDGLARREGPGGERPRSRGSILRRVRFAVAGIASLAAVVSAIAQQQGGVPPPPFPPENPITEAKRVLGKILFWDEQVSSHNTVACGTCHRPLDGGTDGRVAVNSGPDTIFPSPDDIFGSPGVVSRDAAGNVVNDPVFGFGVQVTPRSANTAIMAAYAPEMFWDGRARPTFLNPETGTPSIQNGGALENQATAPILNSVEMAHQGRTWADVRTKLGAALPLGDATSLPPDVTSAIASHPSYASLFQAAFGDPNITGERIAFAIATYERTLVANQTPWDAFIAGNPNAMTQGQIAGWDFFRNSPCGVCHTPPFFTNQTFRNIGLRPPGEDLGRQIVTQNPIDRGRFKVPTLRNVGLKVTHMHNGRIATVQDSVLWYRPNNPARFLDNLDPILPVGVPPDVLPALVDFLSNALTDPRVAQETAPFDKPTIHGGNLPLLDVAPDTLTLSWPSLTGALRYNVYRGDLSSLRNTGTDGLPAAGFGACVSVTDPDTTDNTFVDPAMPEPGQGFFYLKSVVDSQNVERGLGATSDGRAHTVLVPCPQ